jgi:hypothetical protein
MTTAENVVLTGRRDYFLGAKPCPRRIFQRKVEQSAISGCLEAQARHPEATLPTQRCGNRPFGGASAIPTQTRHCKDDKSCPWGAVCGPNGLCCESADGKTCKASPAGLAATALDSPTSHDLAIQETGLGNGGTAGLDSGQGTGGALGWDGSIDLAEDSADAPQTNAAEAGAGGVPGSGGVSSTGGAGGAGGAIAIDAPKADALDAPLGGAGGGLGGSGGGTAGSGGGTGIPG